MACPNCGFRNWDENKPEPECERCGFKQVRTKELPPITLIFCDDCGCTLSEKCSLHPEDRQHEVKL